MSLVGQRLGTLRIDRPLGEGGMGEVYLGFDEKLERRVAVKRLLAEHRLQPEAKSRLLREARLLSKVGHPAICQIFDLVEGPDADHLVLEYVDGETLRQAMRRPIPFARAVDICRQIAGGLAAAHREQVIHRDLKPENVMVTADGRVKILDFGVARAVESDDGVRVTPVVVTLPELASDPDETAALAPPRAASPPAASADFRTRAGTVVGTLHCMSPEQARGERLTTASDLYSFGILMQELFTGRPAYPELPVYELWRAVQQGATERVSDLDPELARLLEEMKSHDPKRRPAAAEVDDRLAWIADQPARRRRRRLLAGAAIAAFVGLAAGLVTMSWLAFEGRRARVEAERRQGQAEELIGFMLGDLRPKLERAGRLELLDAVGERALDYFESVPESELSTAELVRRVEALRQLSEVRSSAGELDAAIEVARRAVALGRALVARAATEPACHLALARAHAALGAALLDSLADPEATLAEFESELAAARAAAALAPDAPEVRRQLGAALADVGVGQFLARQLEASAARFDEALAILEPAATLEPGTPDGAAATEELASALAWASSAFETLGRLADATAARRRNLEIQTTLLERSPGDEIAAHDLATARDFHARLLMWQGQIEEALVEQRAAVTEFERLHQLDPDNADWERSVAVGLGNLGWILAEAERFDEALAELLRSRVAHDTLRRRDPTHRAWARMSGVTALRIATVVAARGDAGRAAREISLAIAALEPLHAADPGDVVAAQRLGEALAFDAELAAARGDDSAARAIRERALALVAPFSPGTGSPTLAALWVQLLLELGRSAEARPVVDRLRASGFRMRRYRAMVERAGL